MTLSALAIRLTEKPLTDRLTTFVEQRKIGILPQLHLSPALKTALSVVLLDYTLYLWHVLNHKAKFLWRFHEMHHQDLDLTATTALRFHFGEMAMSALWRGAQVLIIGTSAKALKLWQSLTLVEIIFHHSNIRLPVNFERLLCRLIVTPRVHAIHHSTRREETDSNWSSGLTVWDWLHGTLKLDVPQNGIKIGVPAYGSPSDAGFIALIKKPFTTQRKSWSPREAVHVKRSESTDDLSLAFESTPLRLRPLVPGVHKNA